VLNIEREHLDFYPDMEAIEKVFGQLLEQTSGSVFYNADDATTKKLCASPRAISFGLNDGADYQGRDIALEDFSSVFCVFREGKQLGEARLNVPGRHNVLNAIGVIALASELGIPFEKIASSLARFQHARRRFEIKYSSERFLLVDDYAHHPTEIRATLATARSAGRKRVVTMFQPHRYSRTQALAHEFGTAFDEADRVVVTDVYPASETPIPGISGRTIANAVAAHHHGGVTYQPRLDRVHCDVGNMLAAGDLVMSLGAGNIHEQLAILAAELVIAEKLKTIAGETGDVRLHEPLAKHTTLRVGGPAQFWVEPRTELAFGELIRFCRRENLPLFVIGRGSNLLVRDGGIRGVVVHPSGGEFEKIEVQGIEVLAGVGVKLKQVAYAARDAGIGELEWMEGIPGEVGGALRMNAGAMGGQTFDHVARIRFLGQEGNAQEKIAAEMEVYYRSVPELTTNYAVSAVFRGQPCSREEIARKLEQSQQHRRATQPAASSAGCIFKNPAVIPAGKLVDELGLKNRAIGKARVSEVHGNFIVNDGGATAAEMLELIETIKAAAREKRGIDLETEVQIVGEEE
jgi:UDP-N-acetylenolpyruvoylglucosamine reductase